MYFEQLPEQRTFGSIVQSSYQEHLCHILRSEILSEQLLFFSMNLVKYLWDVKAVVADVGERCREAG